MELEILDGGLALQFTEQGAGPTARLQVEHSGRAAVESAFAPSVGDVLVSIQPVLASEVRAMLAGGDAADEEGGWAFTERRVFDLRGMPFDRAQRCLRAISLPNFFSTVRCVFLRWKQRQQQKEQQQDEQQSSSSSAGLENERPVARVAEAAPQLTITEATVEDTAEKMGTRPTEAAARTHRLSRASPGGRTCASKGTHALHRRHEG